jgi:sugar transferase EpsL
MIAKRSLDIFGSVLGLILMSPFLFIISIAILWKMGRPVLYRQLRPGLGGSPFTIYKFRTMHNSPTAAVNPEQDEKRLSSLGRFLRATSLDEIPELWNVLRGEMSLVGPRPLLMKYLSRYTEEQMRRHEVKPGITGWAQIKGRNSLSWEYRFQLDVWYVDHRNFWLDVKILFLTLIKTLKREGISAENHATMREFLGSSDHR